MDFDKVRISYALTVSEPGNISLSNPKTANSLHLVATVKQESSPFPDRAVTLLTTYTALDNCDPGAFALQNLESPTDVTNENFKIYMRQFTYRVRRGAIGGVFDLSEREDHTLISVPPPGQGSVKLTWSLAPEHMLRFYERTEPSLEKRLERFTVGQRFKIVPTSRHSVWWTWGSLQHELRDKRLSRWGLPCELSIVRETGEDEGEEIDCRLIDIVDGKSIRTIRGQWAPWDPESDDTDEEPPNVKEMRADNWVFGEPCSALELTCTQIATFEFVE